MMSSGTTLGLRLAVLASTLVRLSNAQAFTISQNLSGQNFFSGFKFNASDIDFNNFGNVHFVSQEVAQSSGLASVNSNGQVILKVDNTTNGAGNSTFGRNTVYLESSTLMQFGSLLIFDVNHIPFGCSVWPSLFTQGQVWPQEGEIDIIENVNLATQNRFSLHVGNDSCDQPTSVANNQTGTISTASGDISNCTVTPTTGQNTVGCVVTENKPNSFGSAFANQGGGVFAALWDADGIAMWYFPRDNVSSEISISNGSPDPTKFGEASAWYPASGCNPSTNFGPQIITLYIDICGAFAGDASVFSTTCNGTCTDLVDDPTNYDDAYWEINYLQVFSNGNSTSTSSSSSGSGSSSSGASGSSPSNTSNSGSSNLAIAGIKEFILAPITMVFLGLLSML